MLSEEALVLFAATAACALLILGVLELVTPSRPRKTRARTAPGRDPWRRARTAPPPTWAVVPTPPGETGAADEPPIERLLRSEAATLPPGTAEQSMHAAPLPPARQPIGFILRRPVMPQTPSAPPESPGPRTISPGGAVPPAEVAAPRETTPSSGAEPGVLAVEELRADFASGRDAIVPGEEAATAKAAQPLSGPVAELQDLATAEAAPDGVAGPALNPEETSVGTPPATFGVADIVGDGSAAVAGSGFAGPDTVAPGDERGQSEHSSAVDRCYALYEARQYAEALDQLTPMLETSGSGALGLDVRETARLWGLAGLAQQALGDHDGARTAFEKAITVAPTVEQPTWQRYLGALALHVGEQLVAHAQSGNSDAEGRIGTLRTAITWLERGHQASPTDAALGEAAESARLKLWPIYEQACGELIQRQDYTLARDLLREALGDQECPAQAQGALRDLVGMTYSGEVGQLTAEAIRRMQEGREDDAVATLDRAEALLATIPGDGLSDKRRQELERRLWWSYTKVGMRRFDGGMYEEALGPLLHALHFGSVGPERLEETKRPLARALESISEVRSPLIQRLAAEGDREGALMLCEKLWTSVRGALDRGMTREELATAFNRTQALFEKLGKPRK